MNQNSIHSDRLCPKAWLRRLAILACLIVGVVFAIRATTGRALATSTGSDSSVTHIPIERIQLGQRVVGRNPIRGDTQTASEITVSNWCRIDLESEHGGLVSFLRPKSWLVLQGVTEGDCYHLDMKEIGVDGPVRVLQITDCPPIEPDDGTGRSVVTGTMQHTAANILSIKIEGEEGPLGVTTTHPIWSADRNCFVSAGELKIGERLRRENGTIVQVTRISPHRGPPQTVYNLEVDGEHVYCVSNGGLLVHNTCQMHHIVTEYDNLRRGPDVSEAVAKSKGILGNANIGFQSGLNLRSTPGHIGKQHSAAYHQYVSQSLANNTKGLTPGTPEYRDVVEATLNGLFLQIRNGDLPLY